LYIVNRPNCRKGCNMLPTTKTIDTQLNIVSDDAKLVREVPDKAEDTTRERFRL
jgi:hypothetical protein